MQQDSTEKEVVGQGSLVKADTAQTERNIAYIYALKAAQSEFDELLPQLQKLELRVRALRFTMRGLSELTKQELDEKYQFPRPLPVNHSQMQRKK